MLLTRDARERARCDRCPDTPRTSPLLAHPGAQVAYRCAPVCSFQAMFQVLAFGEKSGNGALPRVGPHFESTGQLQVSRRPSRWIHLSYPQRINLVFLDEAQGGSEGKPWQDSDGWANFRLGD
jgi:hypothetical protein